MMPPFARHISQRVASISGGIAVGVLGIAGVLKLLDIGEFSTTLNTWTIVPSGMVYPIAIGVPTLELSVILAWIAGLRTRIVFIWSATLLISFTVAYLIEYFASGAPNCGCLGLASKIPFTQSTGAVLGRNALLIAMLGYAAIGTGHDCSCHKQEIREC